MIGLFSNEFPTPAMEFNPSFANSKVAQRSLEGVFGFGYDRLQVDQIW